MGEQARSEPMCFGARLKEIATQLGQFRLDMFIHIMFTALTNKKKDLEVLGCVQNHTESAHIMKREMLVFRVRISL